jgi:hypothetical protein
MHGACEQCLAGSRASNHKHVMPKKTVTFHLDFGAEIIENARYEMQLYGSKI